MSKVRTIIRDLLAATPDAEDYDIAARALAEFTTMADLVAAVLPIVATEVSSHRRSTVRTLERAVFDRGGGMPMEEVPADPLDARRRLLAEGMWTGKRFVIWGQATVEDHTDRIHYLRGQQQAIQATINRHAQAIETIRRYNVRCLDEVADDGEVVA